MEADSTTYDANTASNSKLSTINYSFPFRTCPGNFKLYQEFLEGSGDKSLEYKIIEKLQCFGLLPTKIQCLSANTTCRVVSKMARVIDRVQWVCEECGRKQPIRTGSFFFKLQCSLLQVLQMILAWCEDAEMSVAAQHFDVKPRVATTIYDRLDVLALKELKKSKLGGVNSVVLAEMYPDCSNRLSPDTTDHPHVHRIFMLADTKHIPTYYRLHVIRGQLRKTLDNNDFEEQIIKEEVGQVLNTMVEPQSLMVMGNNVPLVDGSISYPQLAQHCDVDMQRFLTSRIWNQALSLCAASRDLCTELPAACAVSVQRYLDTSLYRLRYGDGFYLHMLKLICAEFTVNNTE